MAKERAPRPQGLARQGIQGDQEAQRRTEAMIQNMAQYDPNLRRYMNQQNYQRGR